uniref:Fe2OG dioxygenase domain-containing protein n=1 Tax=Aplanochytrium stocchinoi TaxID=215587 RepID=A0A7S3LJM8_9STRA|mmetsp:Transcript_30910/g.38150  ORF Transcript_30910/g.38150 Transcript_30910/m.38150 type:complete len:262 (-) Transcript_30910:245-1030(-)
MEQDICHSIIRNFLVALENEVTSMDDMPWPESNMFEANNFNALQFRKVVSEYMTEMERLARRMLPLYAVALGVPENYFEPAFKSPTMRMRLSMYPALPLAKRVEEEGIKEVAIFERQFGIAPHVDTTFFTILATSGPGLVVGFDKARLEKKLNEDIIGSNEFIEWVKIPFVEGTLLVNTGQLLRQLTNDTWIAARHYAVNPVRTSAVKSENHPNSRFSIPFFFNATASYPLKVISTFCSNDNPPKYPPLAYNKSQGVTQGE